MPINVAGNKIKLMAGTKKVRKIYCEKKVVYSAGNICTYIVNGATYQEELEDGESVLSPKSFTVPAVSGKTFAGWSETQNGAPLDYKVMGDDPITLYAIYVAQRIRNFGYTGGMQAFTAPYKGLYLFTLIGPGGGGACSRAGNDSKSYGGPGGKTVVYVALNKGEVLYVGVGGGGTRIDPSQSGSGGGWNGGGGAHSSGDAKSGGGAGATHLGRSNAVLASTTKANVIGVAGGGGGAAGAYPTSSSSMHDGINGGYGGGLNGGNGAGRYDNHGIGGTQTSGGAYGAGAAAGLYGGGSGAGLYGGTSGGQSGAGGGGSGYVYASTTTYKGKAYSNSTTAAAGATGGAPGDWYQSAPAPNNGSVSVDFIAA